MLADDASWTYLLCKNCRDTLARCAVSSENESSATDGHALRDISTCRWPVAFDEGSTKINRIDTTSLTAGA